MQIAKHDCYGTDGVGVRRYIRAGDPIPPGLEVDSSDVVEQETPTATGPAGGDAASSEPQPTRRRGRQGNGES